MRYNAPRFQSMGGRIGRIGFSRVAEARLATLITRVASIFCGMIRYRWVQFSINFPAIVSEFRCHLISLDFSRKNGKSRVSALVDGFFCSNHMLTILRCREAVSLSFETASDSERRLLASKVGRLADPVSRDGECVYVSGM